jgi:hypothetical protein
LKKKLRSVFQKCTKHSAHNIFLGVIDDSEDINKKEQLLLKSISENMTCSKCINHSYIIDSDYIPIEHFLMKGDLANTPKYELAGFIMFIFGIVTFIVMLSFHLWFDAPLVNKNFGNYTVALAAFLVSAALLSERSSGRFSRLAALVASAVAIFSFFANYEN